MPLLHGTLRSVPEPFAVRRGGSTTAGIAVVAPCTHEWADGAVDTYRADPDADAVELYHYTTRVDSTASTWILVAVKGLAAPVLAKEQDEADLDTLIAAIPATGLGATPDWRILGWLEGATFRRDRQHVAVAGATSTLETRVAALEALFTGAQHGDIWRYNKHLGTGLLGVEKYHIGAPGQRLTVVPDDIGALPVWGGSVVAFGHGSSHLATKAFNVLGGLPANWNALSFDDSGWPLAQVATCVIRDGLANPFGANADIIWVQACGVAGQWGAFRDTFTLPGDAIANASVRIVADDELDAFWINGTLVATHGGPVPALDITVPIDAGLLVRGGTNLIAVSHKNLTPPNAGIAWFLTVNFE